MKTCIECGHAKGADGFYVNNASEDGLTSRCRVCTSAYQKARRERLNASKPPEWKKKTADIAAYRKDWLKDKPGYMTQKKREWWQKNKDKMRVRDAVKYALKTGKLVKTPCHVCGEERVEGHHPDYSRPLDVVWLCREHHLQVHHG